MISFCKPIAFILGLSLLSDKPASGSDEVLTNYISKVGQSEKVMVVGTGKGYGTIYPENYFLVDNNPKCEPTKIADIEKNGDFSNEYNGIFDVVVFECLPVSSITAYQNAVRFLKNDGKFITSFPGKVEQVPSNYSSQDNWLSPLGNEGIFFHNQDWSSGPPHYTAYVSREIKIERKIIKDGLDKILEIFSQDTALIFKNFQSISSSGYWKKIKFLLADL